MTLDARIPPWFRKVLETSESLALDSHKDCLFLWERILDALPREAIEAAIDDGVADDGEGCDHELTVARIKGAVVAALEGA